MANGSAHGMSAPLPGAGTDWLKGEVSAQSAGRARHQGLEVN